MPITRNRASRVNPTFRSNDGNSNDPPEGLETTTRTEFFLFWGWGGGWGKGWVIACRRGNSKIRLRRRPPMYFQKQRPGLRLLYCVCTYVDSLPVALMRPLTVVSLAAKPKRTLNAYNKSEWLFKTNCFKRDISEKCNGYSNCPLPVCLALYFRTLRRGSVNYKFNGAGFASSSVCVFTLS